MKKKATEESTDSNDNNGSDFDGKERTESGKGSIINLHG